MVYDIALYVALIIFVIGLIHKIDTWFILNAGVGDRSTPMSKRFQAGLTGVLGTVFSARLFGLIKVFFMDVLLQLRILKDEKDPLAWVMHIFIFVGFILLLLFHALDSIVTGAIFAEYQSTLNPFMFLRNLCGIFVLIGLALAVYRRAVVMKGRIKTTGMDVYAIIILAIIICSGFLLEGLKITSHAEYEAMVEEYGEDYEAADAGALEAYWVDKYGVVSPTVKPPFSEETMIRGLELHENSCLDCHSRPQAAFISYPISRILKPAAVALDKSGFRTLVWYIHFLACFFGLACLAFSKFFHIISTPVSLMVAEVSGAEQVPSRAATRRMLELDGCSHGGICHEECPVRTSRLERIAASSPYEPMYDFLGRKSAADLGSREVSE